MNGWKDALDSWLILGLIGQAVFSTRFLTQWIASEKAGRSVVPTSFWWMSLVGSVMLFLYGLKRHEPVLVLGQCTGLWIYGRNLVLIRRSQSSPAKLGHVHNEPHLRHHAQHASARQSADDPKV